MPDSPLPIRFDFDDGGAFSVASSSEAGVSSFEAVGRDRTTALAAALRGFLALLTPPPPEGVAPRAARFAPIRGEGGDLATLLVDLLEDLWATVAIHGTPIDSLTVDGVLAAEGGRLLAWGYVGGPLDGGEGQPEAPCLDMPDVDEATPGRVVIRGSLRR